MEDVDKARTQLENKSASPDKQDAEPEANSELGQWKGDELSASGELFEKVFASQPDAIFVLNSETPPVIVDCNPAATRIFGYDREDMLGKAVGFLYLDEKEPLMFPDIFYSTTLEKGFMQLSDFQMKRKGGTSFFVDHSIIQLKDKHGNHMGWVSVVHDVTERKQTEDKLKEYRDRLAHLVQERTAKFDEANKKLQKELSGRNRVEESIKRRLRFEQVLASISYRFIRFADIDNAINDSLIDIGTFSEASRVHVFQFREDGKLMDNTHEWCAQGIRPQITKLQNISHEAVPWLMRGLRGGKVIHVPDVLKMPADAKTEKAILQSQDIKTGVMLPLNVGGKLSGFIGFGNNSATGYWKDDDLALLRVFSEIISNALARYRAEEELKKHRVQLELLVGERTSELKMTNKRLQQELAERMRAEENLRRSEEKVRMVIDQSVDGITLIDEQGAIVEWNQGEERITGLKKDKVLGRPFCDVIWQCTAEERRTNQLHEQLKINVLELLNTGQAQGMSNLIEDTIERPDGEQRIVQQVIFPIKVEGGQMVGAISRDITEIKLAEAERAEMERRAHVAGRLATVGEMASGIAHEINDPLTTIIGYAQLLMLKDITDDLREDFEAINDAACQVASIVSRLLTFARQRKPGRSYIDINDAIEKTIAVRAYNLESNNIKVITQLTPDLPWTMADADQLKQVFLNIIINAETEIGLSQGMGKLWIKSESIDNNIRISFRDNGPGIAKEYLDRIFDPFFTTREVGKGAGLGLSVCHGIISEHHGQIYAKSRPGGGATFIVELPVVTSGR